VISGRKFILGDLGFIFKVALLKPLQPDWAIQPVVRRLPVARVKIYTIERLGGDAVEIMASEILHRNHRERLENIAQQRVHQLVSCGPGG
jgi:hypothetical protein